MDEFCKQYTNGWVWIATVIKMYYARGMTYVGIPAQIITLLTFLKVWEETFVYFGVTKPVMYGVFPIVLIGGCVIGLPATPLCDEITCREICRRSNLW